MKVKSLSASSIGTAEQCPWKWYLNYQLGFTEPGNSAALQGTITHHVLEILSRLSIIKHDKTSKYYNVDYLWRICFNRYFRDEPSVAEGIKDDKLKKICGGLKQLVNNEYSPIRDNTISAETPFEIEFKEEEFKIKESGEYLKLRGRIDRIDQATSDTIEIYDYKTGTRDIFGSNPRQKKDLTYFYEKDVQGRIYHLAAKQLYPWAKNIIVVFYYLTDGGAIHIPFADEDLIVTKDIIRRKFKSIQNNNDPERILVWSCKYMCGFFRDGTCETVWKEKDDLGHKFIEQKYYLLNVKKKR